MVAADTKEVLEEAAIVAEDAVNLVEKRVSWLASNPKTVVIFAAATGALFGGLACFLVVNSRLRTKYQQLADEQVADVKRHYAIIRKDGPLGDLETLAAQYEEPEQSKADEIIREEGYVPYDKVETRAEPPIPDAVVEQVQTARVVEKTVDTIVERNIFESDDPERYFDFDEELKRRKDHPDKPYVITKEEFDQNDDEYEQTALTYYESDDVLVDARDQPVDDTDSVVGDANLLRFGHGSGDKNVVYICNNELDLLIEVVHSDGSYAQEVLGFIKHSDERPPRKFRKSDE